MPNNREDLTGLTLEQAEAVKEAESGPKRDPGVVPGRGSETIRKIEQEAAQATTLKNRRKRGRLGHHTSDKSRGVAPQPVPEALLGEEVEDDFLSSAEGDAEFDDVEMEVVS